MTTNFHNMTIKRKNVALTLLLFSFYVSECTANMQIDDKIQFDMVQHLQKSNYTHGKAEIIFLLDRSGSVGAADFEVEKGFVESFLTHVIIDGNATRVAVISYSDTAVRHIDYLRDPKNKCFLAQELRDIVYEDSGATNIVAAFEAAAEVLKNARPNVNKVVVLVSDGFANIGGDPIPYAAQLKNDGVEIFCFGVGRFLQTQLEKMASSLQHVYTCNGFNEFKRLARKIRGDPHEISWSNQESKPKCDHLCDSPYKGESFDPGCCDPDAMCSCFLLSGKHSCVCKPGYYGLSGLAGACKACPRGTYKSRLEPVSACLPCPPGSTTGEMASTRMSDCYCKEGHSGDPSKNITCTKISCPLLQKPNKGYILGPCDTIFGSTCHFMCEEGYELVDSFSDVRHCKSDGKWSGTTAVCRSITCNYPPQPEHGRMRCEQAPLNVGKKCLFVCERGYIQQGSTERECTVSKQWTGTDSHCIPVECGVPHRLRNGYHSCRWSKKVLYGETCAYSCNYGFLLKGPRFFTCRENGKLVNEQLNTNLPYCQDITPPDIVCPRTIKVRTIHGKSVAVVTWDVPLPSDNSGITPKLYTDPINIQPNMAFPIGSTTFDYIAVDSSDLRSSCRMNIIVVDNEPPVVLRCPSRRENSTNSPSTEVHWDEPIFQDNSGKPLKLYQSAKSGTKFQQGNRMVTYIAYDESRNAATCEFEVIVSRTSCRSYPPPINGALACDDWPNGQLCQTYCNERFDFLWEPADWYFCNSEAKWETTPENEPLPWPDCAKRTLPGEVKQKVGFYYSGDCNDPQIQMVIKKMFLRNYYNHLTQTSICHNKGACTVKNVDIKCGKLVPNIRRRKRDIWEYAENDRLELEFDISIDVDQELNSTEGALQDFLETVRSLNWEIEEDVLTTPNTFGNSSFTAEEMEKSTELVVVEEQTTLVCNPGTVLKEDLCVMCPAGTYFESGHEECVDCPIGQYQDMEGQLRCEKCPDGSSTEHERTRSGNLCKGLCSPGTFSETGMETCMACPVGSYQNEKGKHACYSCPNGTTTENAGSVSFEDCQETCPPGSYSLNALQPCEPCPLHHYQPSIGQSECLECPSHLSTKVTGSTKETDCVDLDPCLQNSPCLNNATCLRKGRDVDCLCDKGFEGDYCQKDIDECLQNPCWNEGECINTEGSFVCICQDGFDGQTCEDEIDECLPLPCVNNATCLDEVDGFTCVCLPGYEGATCETERELCFREVVCLNGGKCVHGESESNSFCSCKTGYSGLDCSYDVNECENVTCLNGGSCIDGQSSFFCSCPKGYSGTYCEEDIDECAQNECFLGATCQDLVGSYKCLCQPGWNGTHCENKIDSNFILVFPGSTATIANMASITLNADLSDVTISMWIQTNDTERFGTPLSYAVTSNSSTDGETSTLDNALTINDCSEIKVYVNNEPVVTRMQIADGKWHHLAFTWSSENVGKWSLYKNGILQYEGNNLHPNGIIRGGGILIIGQEQDTVGGGFSPVETFTGSISRVNIWSSSFSQSNITQLYKMDEEFPNKVVAWPDFLGGLKGDVQVLQNIKPMIA